MTCPKCNSDWVSDREITMVIRKTADYKPKGNKRFRCLSCSHTFGENILTKGVTE